jgi:hypothetical protein
MPTLLPASLLDEWSYPVHPNLRLVRRHAHALLAALEGVPAVTLKARFAEVVDGDPAAAANREELEVGLERIRALLPILRGRSLSRALRQVRSWLPELARDLQQAADAAIERLVEAEQSFLFALGEPVDDEWLPEPAPPGVFPCDEPSIPLPEP